MEQDEMLKRYCALYPVLWRTAMRRLRQRQDAEDALHNAFLRAWQSCGSLRRSESFPSWMRRIVDHEAINLRRKQVNLIPVDALPPPPMGECVWVWRMDWQQACGQLSVGVKRCFILYYLQGMSVCDIASHMNIAESTVRGYLFRARKYLNASELATRIPS